MTNPLHASYYADHAMRLTVSIEQNEPVARDTFRLRFRCPEIARRVKPGQFLMFRLAGFDDPLLGRALAVYDVVYDQQQEPVGLEVLYLVVGKLTSKLAQCRSGIELEIWGPLGNGFELRPTRHLIMVAGGIGQTPFLTLAKSYLGTSQYGAQAGSAECAEKVTLCYGARNGEYLACVDDFQELGVDVRICTDDGSRGHHGLVTDILKQVLAEETAESDCQIVCCGPEPMMEAVAKIAQAAQKECQVSLETPMACGIGICFSCVTRVYEPSGEWDYRRTCVEGPIFDAEKIAW